MPQSPIPNRDDRIDLQPDNANSRVYNIDPTTGLPLDPQYEVRDAAGNVVYTDGSGNVLFGGLTTFNDLSIENVKGAKRFSKTITQYDLDSLLKTLDFSISELTGGRIDSINFIPGNIGSGGSDGNGGSDGGFGDPGGTGTRPGRFGTDDLLNATPTSVLELIDLINSLRDEIDRLNGKLSECEGLESAIDELKAELDQLLSDNADLIDLVEALQACKVRLERVLTAKNNEVIRLSDELARAAVDNANLEQRINQLERLNAELIQQNTELATRPEIQTIEVPVPVVVNQGGSTSTGTNTGSGTGATGVDDPVLAGNDGGNKSTAIPTLLKQYTANGLTLMNDYYRFINDTSFTSTYTEIRTNIINPNITLDEYKRQSNRVSNLLSSAIDSARRIAAQASTSSRGGDDRLVETYQEFYRDLEGAKSLLQSQISKS